MHKALIVRIVERASEVMQQRLEFAKRDPAAFSNDVAQLVAVDKIQHDVPDAVRFARFVEFDDVWMTDPGKRLRLSCEPFREILVAERVRHDLDRHQLAIALGLVNLAHAASANQGKETVLTEPVPRERSGAGSSGHSLSALELIQIEPKTEHATVDDALRLHQRRVEQQTSANGGEHEGDTRMALAENQLQREPDSHEHHDQHGRDGTVDQRPIDEEIDLPQAVPENGD